MALSLGIIGLPNVGKSTLFNALSAARAEVSNYPFCTIDPNVAVVPVPDSRLEQIRKITKSGKATLNTIEFVDIAGLVRGAHKGEGLGNQFLSHIRSVAAIIQVVRCFADENISHVEAQINPKNDIETINLELVLADLLTVEKYLDKCKSAAKAGDKKLLKQAAELENIRQTLNRGIPLRLAGSAALEITRALPELSLLTVKPMIYVGNVAEAGSPEQIEIVKNIAQKEAAPFLEISAKIEAEINDLPPADRQEFLASAGIMESGLARLIQVGYQTLNLITFFTANAAECRAWTCTKGTKIQQAAGKIHSDMEKGFIAAEVMHFADLVVCGTPQVCREKGRLQVEGKQYVVSDGDLIQVRFGL